MHTSAHHHHGGASEQATTTHGRVMNLGRGYDLMVWFADTILLRGKLRTLRQRTIDLAQLRFGETVLDVGCGTGTLAIEAYKRISATGHMHGIDPGTRQIARARAKARRANLPIDFQVGVIEHLPFSDQSVDVVLSTLMMHHLPDDLKRVGLAEIARVLKPGGRLVIADFKRPEKPHGRVGAGEIGAQDLPQLVKELGFTQVQSGDILMPSVMGFDGAGFVTAQTASQPRSK